MAHQLILVNGLPASGKSTLAASLGAHLDVPVVSKDAFKEMMADVAAGRVSSRELGALASEAMWRLAAAMDGLAIVESWWFKPRDLRWVEAGLSAAGNPATVEVWCDVSAELAWSRYLARARHPIHPAGEDAREPWADWVNGAEPLGIGPVVRVATDRRVNLPGLARDVAAAFRSDVPDRSPVMEI